jgi:hypothetical protein
VEVHVSKIWVFLTVIVLLCCKKRNHYQISPLELAGYCYKSMSHAAMVFTLKKIVQEIIFQGAIKQ